MKVLVSWLREFVDVTASPEELGETLSMRGFELAGVEVAAGAGVAGAGAGGGAGDAVLDFEITANRPDAMSVLGLARETATAYSLPLGRPPAAYRQPAGTPVKEGAPGDVTEVTVRLEAPDLCPRYSAAVVDVTIGPSPAWLAARLQACGVRPINNVVDVTNYVLVELGQPMHAFDLAKLGGRTLRIRHAAKGERLKTLDGVDRTLDPEMLVIADADRPQAVAGVMGGSLSEVSSTTKTVVLESACFEPKSVRRTSKKLGLKTEASARFERGSDINATVPGIERACALLENVAGGRVRGPVIDQYPAPVEPKTLTLRRARIERVLGQTVPDADVERTLTGLGFTVVRAGQEADGWKVTVPTFRVDVSGEADLIEEVGRHYGYDRLPATFPALDTPPPPPDPRVERDRLVRRVLLAGGCSEAVSFSFIAPDEAARFAEASDLVPISNPLTAQFAVLRPSLVPGLLSAVAHNRHRQRPDVRLFEIGAAITRHGQRQRVALAWTGDAGPSHWSGSRREVDFFDVKGLVERIAEALQVELTFTAAPIPAFLVAGQAASVFAGGRRAGVVGLVAHDQGVWVAELDLDALDAAGPRPDAALSGGVLRFKPLPRYPSIARDISIVVDDTLPASTVRGTIASAAPATLVSAQEFDRYQGKGVPDGRVSLSFRLTFRSADRTLTDAEIDAAMKEILAALARAHRAVQR
ncbi:MAG TPA: phenylalanine--tRNA ligase subunit beta [Vicinamibacterales bacterium]|nr:phenylalanine--tRNA ligase subunit beta [Vicinamibacterales bacterium]